MEALVDGEWVDISKVPMKAPSLIPGLCDRMIGLEAPAGVETPIGIHFAQCQLTPGHAGPHLKTGEGCVNQARYKLIWE
jgi:hypothetical protein